MTWPLVALIGGIILLMLSAEMFVDGAAAAAKRAGLAPLLIGMVVIGFGSSLPEVVVSAFSAWNGNPGLALGNAFGSNITNIALTLGVTALVRPVAVKSSVLQRELPLLTLITAIAALLLFDDRRLDRTDGWALIGAFVVVMGWSIWSSIRIRSDELATDVSLALTAPLSMPRALTYLVLGLAMLVISSRILVWGGTTVARALGIGDLIIGLTVVAVGTSLPELASSIVAVRKGEYELAVGNVIGSNIFNTSIAVGVAGVIAPARLSPAILTRDFPVMAVLTLILFIMGYWFRGPGTGRINRFEGAMLVLAYCGYNIVLILTAIARVAT
jgi:cation:H+ antiporter